jgi:deoxyribose-phosphate aldolase
MNEKSIASYIDHTALKATTTQKDIVQLCDEAKKYGFYSVCVPPYYVESCQKLLSGSDVKLCTVIGFPLGYQTTTSKIDEIKRMEEMGVDEVDVVVNIAAVKSGDWEYVQQEIESLATKASIKGIGIKIILETCYLSEEEIIRLCNLSASSGVNFVKTSTGFGKGGATKEHVALMKQTVGKKVKVKASGGIRTYNDAKTMIEAGAERIGASSGVQIVKGKN